MAYDETLATRIRAALAPMANHDEIKMFGGLCFTVGGHMCCGVMKDEMMLRVGPEAYEAVLAKRHARVMDFTGRPMRNMVIVARKGLSTDNALRGWLKDAVAFATALPPKAAKKQKRSHSAKSVRVPAEPGFTGFGPGTSRFLKGLSDNNNKGWFDAHRADYDQHYVVPALAFVAAIGPRLQRLSASLNYAPKVNGSLFRINRDVRFSADKTPYKDHLDMWFWEGPKKGWSTPGFFLRLTPSRLIVGAGMHRFDKVQADAFRHAVVGRAGHRLGTAIHDVKEAGFSVAEPTRKKVPKGFDGDHPRANLLRHDGLTVTWEGRPPKEVRTAAFVDWCETKYRDLLPIEQWLLKNVAPTANVD